MLNMTDFREVLVIGFTENLQLSDTTYTLYLSQTVVNYNAAIHFDILYYTLLIYCTSESKKPDIIQHLSRIVI